MVTEDGVNAVRPVPDASGDVIPRFRPARDRDNKIKVIKRRAYGLPTFEGIRRRVLVAGA
jgi:hypothetical protein